MTKGSASAASSKSVDAYQGLTEEIIGTIKTYDPSDPVYAQYVQDPQEDIILPEERSDPIGDHPHSPVPGIVHRHPDRVLIKITDTCAAYCRFCFRKDMVGQGQGVLKTEDIDTALSYIEHAPAVREVIFTGGDPLTVSPRRLEAILDRLYAIDHLDIIRFHTRTPMMRPDFVTETLCTLFEACPKALYVVLHINHEQELSPAVCEAIKKLDKTGAVLLSQSVLLKGVNNTVQDLENLFRKLVTLKIKPYYLHHPDLAPGTSHFRVALSEGQDLMAGLRRRVSGLCLPSYVLDIPGGYGKVPVESCAARLKNAENETYEITDLNGATHTYNTYTKI